MFFGDLVACFTIQQFDLFLLTERAIWLVKLRISLAKLFTFDAWQFHLKETLLVIIILSRHFCGKRPFGHWEPS